MENIVLRQQLTVFKRENPRPKLTKFDRIFWVFIRRSWNRWKNALIFVKSETVVCWHRKGFKLYWKFISKHGKQKQRWKPKISREMRELIYKMAHDNPTWRAPRIHGELLKLGYKISERTVSRYMPKRVPPGDKIKKWLAFLHNQKKGIMAMDLFTLPTLFFRQLYGFFIIHHDRRKIIHFNVTFHPTAEWVTKQIIKAFSIDIAPKYMIYDRDSIFSILVTETFKSFGIDPVRTSYRSPWQNGIAERWVGSVRRELLNHVIILNQRHLYNLLEEYVEYYNNDRTHYIIGERNTHETSNY
jgi:transposase InsO family protein